MIKLITIGLIVGIPATAVSVAIVSNNVPSLPSIPEPEPPATQREYITIDDLTAVAKLTTATAQVTADIDGSHGFELPGFRTDGNIKVVGTVSAGVDLSQAQISNATMTIVLPAPTIQSVALDLSNMNLEIDRQWFAPNGNELTDHLIAQANDVLNKSACETEALGLASTEAVATVQRLAPNYTVEIEPVTECIYEP